MSAIPRVDTTISNVDFIFRFLLANSPCVLSPAFSAHWPALREWAIQPGGEKEGEPDLEYLCRKYGADQVPVLLGDDCRPRQMAFASFVEQFCSVPGEGGDLLVAYLKDWHFQGAHPNEQVYELPAFLRPDWVNHEQWTAESDAPFGGDYRFVYFGTRGSWTRFHSDVLNSFSWSANVCGRKLWYLVPPGAEERVELGNGAFVEDLRPHLDKFSGEELIQFVQGPGEIVFVPSGWWHQVHNLETTISINHNVINAFNIDRLLALMGRRLDDVRREIADVHGLMIEEEFENKCQSLLLIDCKMNEEKLVQLLDMVISTRPEDNSIASLFACDVHKDRILECKRDARCLERMRSVWTAKCRCQGNDQFCASCLLFIHNFELLCAFAVKRLVVGFFVSRISRQINQYIFGGHFIRSSKFSTSGLPIPIGLSKPFFVRPSVAPHGIAFHR